MITDSTVGNPIVIVTNFNPEIFTSAGSNTFMLAQSGMIAVNVFVDRGLRYKTTEWTQSGQTITLIGTPSTGKKIYITP